MRSASAVVCVALLLLAAAPMAAAGVNPPAAPAPPAENAFLLAGQGVNSAIIIPDKRPPYRFPYWGGHAILARYLQAVTGRAVPVLKASDYRLRKITRPVDYRIWVGDQPAVRAAIGDAMKGLDDDGFVLRARGRDLYVCGTQDWGTHFAACELLERFAGCRWYAPGPRFWQPKVDGVVGLFHIVPRAAALGMPADTNLRIEPSYKMRWMRYLPRHTFRMRQRDLFHHNLSKILPPRQLGRTHPEYFPLIGGKRYVPPAGREYDFQPCVSNPAVVALVVAAAEKHFAAHPADGSFSVGMNDSGKFCQCPRCAGLAPKELTTPPQRNAYAFFHFYNQIAQRLAKRYPDKRLGCLAYAALSQLPKDTIRLHPMIVPYLTRDSAQLFDPPEVKEFAETVGRWSRLATRMGIYEYVYGRGFVIPRIYNRYILTNIARRYGVGVDGFYAEDYPNWGLDGPKYWLIAKLLWDHTLDPEKLKAEYYGNLFGPAAGRMRAYFDFLEETWCSQKLPGTRSNYRWLNDPKQLDLFPPEACDRAARLLQQARDAIAAARTAAPGKDAADYLDRAGKRIEFFATTFELTRTLSKHRHLSALLEAEAGKAEPSLARSLEALADLEALDVRKAYDRVTALARGELTAIHPVPLAELSGRFARGDGPARLVHRVVEDAAVRARKVAGSNPAKFRAAVALALTQRAGAGAVARQAAALARLTRLAQQTGALFVSPAAKAPVLDGRIGAAEWGTPAYRGRFFRPFGLRQATRETTLWAVSAAGKLYLALDCPADPATLGADVTGHDTDGRYPPKMARDSAVSVCLVRPGAAFQRILVNVNGSVQDFGVGTWDVCEARASRTGRGWQVEMALDADKTNAAPRLLARGPTFLAVSRYDRAAAPAPGRAAPAECSTLAPVADLGGNVGHGNHPALMAFVWGPRLVYR